MINHMINCIYDVYKKSGIEKGLHNVSEDYKNLRQQLNILSNGRHKKYYDIYTQLDTILLNVTYIDNEDEFKRQMECELQKIRTLNELTKLPLFKYTYVNTTQQTKKNKKAIPAIIRRMVWDKYIGEDKGKSICYCCKMMDISQLNFVCGHVVSEHDGGATIVDNLRPICQLCNLSMGTMNMDNFKDHYFY